MEFVGEMSVEGKRFIIVVARFNRWITGRLLEGATRELVRLGVSEDEFDVAWVPGAFELPQAARAAAASGRYHGVICVGAVIKGETTHNEHVAAACVEGLRAASDATGVPIALGVITANTFDQAVARCCLDGRPRGRNFGADAASAAVEMVSLLGRLRKGK